VFLEIKDTNLSHSRSKYSDCFSSSYGGNEQETISEADKSTPSALKISGNGLLSSAQLHKVSLASCICTCFRCRKHRLRSMGSAALTMQHPST
jgi:hypothetical protein